MSKKPGVILYFELECVLDLLSDEDAGKLFRAIFSYAQGNRIPSLPDSLIVVWPLIQQRLDADNKRYYDQCDDKSYAAYVRWQKEKKLDFMSKEEWIQVQKQQALEDLERYSSKS